MAGKDDSPKVYEELLRCLFLELTGRICPALAAQYEGPIRVERVFGQFIISNYREYAGMIHDARRHVAK